MDLTQKRVVCVLGAICVVGAFGIPLGDPKFLFQAITLESSFIALAILSARKFKYSFIPNFVIAAIVIVGNTASPKHAEIMWTLHPFYNAIVLLVGGYILQGFLIVTNSIAYRQYRCIRIRSKPL